MAQAGIHSMVGMAVRKWTPDRKWLMLGIVLGNLLPDADNLAVAAATLTGRSTEGLHRTFTHSLFTVTTVIIVFYVVAWATKWPRWGNLGLGLGIGILMHILLDLLVWFNGVEILWPIPSWVNLWSGVTPSAWWSKLMMPIEFLFFAVFLGWLEIKARRAGTDGGYLRALRVWTIVQGVLFVVFTILVYAMASGFMIPFGALYLLSLAAVLVFLVRWRRGELPAEARALLVPVLGFVYFVALLSIFWFPRYSIPARPFSFILAAAFLFEMSWCRYLCPLNAVMSPLSKIGLFKVRRDAGRCNACGACDRVCLQRIRVSQSEKVTRVDCTNCLDCVSACKVPGAMDLGL